MNPLIHSVQTSSVQISTTIGGVFLVGLILFIGFIIYDEFLTRRR